MKRNSMSETIEQIQAQLKNILKGCAMRIYELTGKAVETVMEATLMNNVRIPIEIMASV